MADYINKNILCQAYVHVETDDLSEQSLENLTEHLTQFLKSRADFFLYPDPEIEIELKEGSLKLYATVVGTVTTLFAGVANYPDFREGAIQIYEDAKRLSEYVAAESIFSTKAKHDQIVRIEARTGVIGSLRKIVADFDSVKNMNGTVYADRLANKLATIKEDIGKLIDNLRSREDEVLVKDGLKELLNNLPKTPTPPPKKRNPTDHVVLYRNEIRSIKRLLSR